MTTAEARLLLVTEVTLTAYRWGRGRLIDAVTFGSDAAGAAAFGDYLAEEPGLPNRMLLDLVGEEFRGERLPHVWGGRGQMLRRTAARLFRATPYRHWAVQGREANGRRDTRVLFSALTNPETVAGWTERMLAAKAPLVNIRSVAHLSEAMLAPLGIGGRDLLLVSDGENSGLRQSFFRDGRLAVSRLSPSRGVDAAGWPGFVLGEVTRTVRYLQHLQLLAFASPLDVYVVGDGAQLQDMVQGAAETEPFRLHPLPVAECAARLALPTAGGPRFADALYAQLALRGPARNEYAQPHERHYAQQRATRQALGWGGWALLAAALMASAEGLLQAWSWTRTAAEIDRQIADYRRLAAERQADGGTADGGTADGVDAHRMRAVVDTVEALYAAPMMPERLLAQVGGVLAGYPEFQVERLHWAAGDAETLLALGGGDPSGDGGGGPPALHHAALVEGRIAPFDGDYRHALSRLEQLLAALRVAAPQAVTVEALRRPLDLSPAGSVSGNAAQPAVEAPYALRIVVKADG